MKEAEAIDGTAVAILQSKGYQRKRVASPAPQEEKSHQVTPNKNRRYREQMNQESAEQIKKAETEATQGRG